MCLPLRVPAMPLTNTELTEIKGALLSSKTVLQQALEVAGRTNCANLYGLIDWTIASLASQLEYVNEELSEAESRQKLSCSSAARSRHPL